MPRLTDRQKKPRPGGRTTALVYARKSLVKRGGIAPASPEMQAEAVQRRARELHLTPELYTDADGWRSGRDENRAAWQQLRARLADPDIAAVIIYSWDRAVRNVRLLLTLADELEALGIRLISVSDNIDTTTAAGRFQLTVIGGVGEFESNAASERRIQTIDYLRRHKGRHYGTTPFGAERVKRDGDLVLVPSARRQPNGTDHAALAHLYELYAKGDTGQMALTGRLNREGWRFRDRNGKLRPFNVKDVRRLLYNHWLYAGYIVVGRAYQGEFEVLPGSHGPILPPELTQAVAARYATYKRGFRRERAAVVHPLTRLIRCGCGCELTGERHNRRSLYVHANRQRCALGRKFGWNAQLLESQVRAHVAGLTLPPNLAAAADHDLARALAREHSGRSSAAEQARLTGAIDRLAELYAEGEISREKYDSLKAGYTAELEALDAGGAALPYEQAAAAGLVASAAEASPVELRELVRLLYAAVEVGPDGTLAFTPQEWAKTWA